MVTLYELLIAFGGVGLLFSTICYFIGIETFGFIKAYKAVIYGWYKYGFKYLILTIILLLISMCLGIIEIKL